MYHHRHWAKEVFISHGVTLRTWMLTLWLSRGWVFEETAEGFGLLVPGRMRNSDKQLSRLRVEGSVSLVSVLLFFFFSSAFVCRVVVFQLGCQGTINRGKKMQGDECRRSLFLHSFLFLQDKRKTCLEMICLLAGFFPSLPEGREWCKQEQACCPFLEVRGAHWLVHSARLQLIKLKTGSGVCVSKWPSPGKDTALSSGLGCYHTRKRAVTFGYGI